MDLNVESLESFGRLIQEHRPRLLRTLQNRIDVSLRHRIDPEDVLAEAFLAARGKWPTYCTSQPISISAWLYQQVQDALTAAWRRHRRGCRDAGREMPWPEHSSAALALGLFGAGTSPSRAAVRREMAAKVHVALALLKPHHREILQMRHFDELPFKEVAEILGVETNTAHVRYVRALDRLKSALGSLGVSTTET